MRASNSANISISFNRATLRCVAQLAATETQLNERHLNEQDLNERDLNEQDLPFAAATIVQQVCVQ